MKKIVSFALLALMGLVLVACGGKKPEEVAKQYVEYAYKGDADAMLKLVNIPDNAKDGSKELVSGKLKQAAAKSKEEAERKGGLKEVVVDSSEIDDPNGKGTVKLTAHFKNDGSDSQSSTVRVIRADKQWKVNF